MTYGFQFPASIHVSVQGSSADEERAYADACAEITKALESVKGMRISVTFRGGKCVDRQFEEDPR